MVAWERVNGIVWGVIGLHLFIYAATVTCVIIPWLSYSVPGATHLLLLTAEVLASLASLIAAVVSDPGWVPDHYAIDTEAQQRKQHVVEVKKKDGGVRVCQKCGQAKPPRAHHCRVCRRCVMRMDHHCPWLNNCVGHGNYRAFLHFLLYAAAATCHALGLLGAHALHAASAAVSTTAVIRTGPHARVVILGGGASLPSKAVAHYSIGWAAFQVAATAMSLPLALALAMLLGWNVWLLSQNKTTIEYHEGITAQVRAHSSDTSAKQHPYNLGPVGNLEAICGTAGLSWCLPLEPSAAGTGLEHPTIWDDEPMR